MIEHIQYKDQELPFLYSWSAHKEWIKLVEKVEDDASVIDLTDNGIHSGFVHGAKKEGKKAPFKLEEMRDIFDDDPEFLSRAMDAYTKHLKIQKKIQDKLMGSLQ